MRILLDTHAFLWADGRPERLRGQQALVRAAETELLVSAVTSWEVAIKYLIGRLDIPASPVRYVPEAIRLLQATPLPIEHAHALAVAELPMHHRDPFDRLLIAQAQLLHVPIVTADPAFADYDVDILAID